MRPPNLDDIKAILAVQSSLLAICLMRLPYKAA
jgi:hypothetical protein